MVIFIHVSKMHVWRRNGGGARDYIGFAHSSLVPRATLERNNFCQRKTNHMHRSVARKPERGGQRSSPEKPHPRRARAPADAAPSVKERAAPTVGRKSRDGGGVSGRRRGARAPRHPAPTRHRRPPPLWPAQPPLGPPSPPDARSGWIWSSHHRSARRLQWIRRRSVQCWDHPAATLSTA